MIAPPVWHLRAGAKLNLYLQVTGRRPDGYHLLDTLFHELELHDELWLRRRAHPGVTLRVSADDEGLLVSAGPDNLVVRALDRLVAFADVRCGFDVLLHKRIPAGGGLGGGSSDAAAALRLGAAALGGVVTADQLHALATRLGADVPFFLAGGSQRGRGIGDELSVEPVPARHFVLLLPPFGCDTAAVYKMFATLWNGPCQGVSVPSPTVSEKSDAAERMGFHNALLPAAERVQPALADLRRRVERLGVPRVCMTGSGSTLFVPCDAAELADRIAASLRQALAGDGVRVLVTRSVAGPGEAGRREPEQVAAPPGLPGPD